MSDKPRLDKVYEQTIMLDFPDMPPRVECHTQQAINSVVANMGLTAQQLANIEIVPRWDVFEGKLYIAIALAWRELFLCDIGEFYWENKQYPGAALELKAWKKTGIENYRFHSKLLATPITKDEPPYIAVWQRVMTYEPFPYTQTFVL